MHEVVNSGLTVPFNGLDFQTARREIIAASPRLQEELQTRTQAKMAKLAEAGRKKNALSIKEIEQGRSDIFRINPLHLEIEEGWNSRDLNNPDNIEHIEWLSRNIPEVGQIDPIEVQFVGGKFIIRDGHCRYFGIALAISRGWECETVKVVTVERGKNDLDHILQQQLRNSGKRLSPMEVAVNLQKALATGASIEMIAKKLSRTKPYLDRYLSLLEADTATQTLVNTGLVSATLVSNAVREHGAQEAGKLVEAAVEQAKTEGKERVTKGSLLKVQGKMTPIKALTAINVAIDLIEQAETESGDQGEKVEISREQWEMLKKTARAGRA